MNTSSKRRCTLALGLATSAAHANMLTWSSTLDALSLDPHSTNNSFTNAFVGNTYEALVRFKDKLEIEPALATSWKTLSPTVWRFALRQGVKFHNGETFDADDVVFAWQRTNTPGSLVVKGNLSDLKEVRKVDASTVDVETRAPLSILPNDMVQHRPIDGSDLQKQQENYANRNASDKVGSDSTASRHKMDPAKVLKRAAPSCLRLSGTSWRVSVETARTENLGSLRQAI